MKSKVGITKIAILGAGRVAQHYKNMFLKISDVDYSIVAVCDQCKITAYNFSKNWLGCEAFTNIEEMLDKHKPHLVLILTPSGFHYLHARICLESGCNVLVEKPTTLIPNQTVELVRLAKKLGLIFCVAFQNRLNPAVIQLKEAVSNNRFGKIFVATMRLRWCRLQEYYEDGWHGTWKMDGGVISQQAIHHLDALNWIFGPIDSVCATMANQINHLEAEDTMVAIIKFTNGALGTVEATTAARPSDIEASISIIGENGNATIGGLALNKIENWTFVKSKKEDHVIKHLHSTDVQNGYGNSHADLLRGTIKSLQAGLISSPVEGDTTIETIKLIHALYSSCENGTWISLRNNPISSKLGLPLTI